MKNLLSYSLLVLVLAFGFAGGAYGQTPEQLKVFVADMARLDARVPRPLFIEIADEREPKPSEI